MRLTMKFDLHFANLGKFQLVTIERISTLRVGKRIIPANRFEAWVSRCFTILHTAKECLKCFVKPLCNVLQYLRVDLF